MQLSGTFLVDATGHRGNKNTTFLFLGQVVDQDCWVLMDIFLFGRKRSVPPQPRLILQEETSVEYGGDFAADRSLLGNWPLQVARGSAGLR